MAPYTNPSLMDEVNERLDNLFGDAGAMADTLIESNTLLLAASPLKNMKSIVLSLDWEITDRTMEIFGEEADRLLKVYEKDKNITTLLKMLGALGRYIRKKTVEAHPSSIKMLHSVYTNLETICLSDDLTPETKKRIVNHEIKKYKELKGVITIQKEETRALPSSAVVRTDDPKEPTAPDMDVQQPGPPDDRIKPEEKSPDSDGGKPGIEHLDVDRLTAYILDEVRKTIRQELETFRYEVIMMLKANK